MNKFKNEAGVDMIQVDGAFYVDLNWVLEELDKMKKLLGGTVNNK